MFLKILLFLLNYFMRHLQYFYISFLGNKRNYNITVAGRKSCSDYVSSDNEIFDMVYIAIHL